jgi:hypothetical protein
MNQRTKSIAVAAFILCFALCHESSHAAATQSEGLLQRVITNVLAKIYTLRQKLMPGDSILEVEAELEKVKLKKNELDFKITGKLNVTPDQFEQKIQSFQGQTILAINLDECQWVTNDHLELLPTSLMWLSLSGCTGFTKPALSHLENLGQLYLKDCKNLTNEAVQNLPTSLTKILSMVRSDCARLTEPAFSNLENLDQLCLTGCENLKDEAISKLPPSLTRLFLGDSTGLTNPVFSGLTSLTELYLNGCTGLTNPVFSDLTELTELSLYGCTGLTNPSFSDLTRLPKLFLSNLTRLTNPVFSGLTNLTELSLYGCTGLTDPAIGTMLAKLPKLEIVKGLSEEANKAFRESRQEQEQPTSAND